MVPSLCSKPDLPSESVGWIQLMDRCCGQLRSLLSTVVHVCSEFCLFCGETEKKKSISNWLMFETLQTNKQTNKVQALIINILMEQQRLWLGGIVFSHWVEVCSYHKGIEPCSSVFEDHPGASFLCVCLFVFTLCVVFFSVYSLTIIIVPHCFKRPLMNFSFPIKNNKSCKISFKCKKLLPNYISVG